MGTMSLPVTDGELAVSCGTRLRGRVRRARGFVPGAPLSRVERGSIPGAGLVLVLVVSLQG